MKRATVGMSGLMKKALDAIAPWGGILIASVLPFRIASSFAAASLILYAPQQALGQINAEPGSNTSVNLNGNTFDITGGQLSGTGNEQNLFHSFQQFGLNSGQIANFLANPNIRNILGRVMGGEPSIINGRIQVTVQGGSGNPNLFLINPAGIVFGPGASLNVPASFTATTATSIGFGNNWFNAAGANNYDVLVGSPDAFAFKINQPGAIINIANLSVSGGDLTLIGGTVVSTGQLTTAGGRITLAAVPGTNLVRMSVPDNVLSLEFEPLASASNQPGNWTLPVATLPELLTGGDMDSASGLTLNNGQVVLTSSGQPINNGDIVAVGNIDTSSSVNSSTTANGGSITLKAAANLTTGDINTSAVSGDGGFVKLSATGNITTGNINTTTVPQGQPSYQQDGEGSVNISTNGNISVKDIKTTMRAVNIVGGSINTGNIVTYDSQLRGSPAQGSVTLEARTGDILVDYIKASGGVIDINAYGLFRATGTFDFGFGYINYASEPETRVAVKDSPELINFFISQGFSREDIENSQAEVSIFPSIANSPVSVAALYNSARITIRHGGASVPSNGGSIQIQGRGGSYDFVIGPNDSPVQGQQFVYLPDSSSLNPNQPFPSEGSIDLQRNIVSSTSLDKIPGAFPANVSGTAGAIMVGGANNRVLTQSLRNIPFEPTFPGSDTVGGDTGGTVVTDSVGGDTTGTVITDSIGSNTGGTVVSDPIGGNTGGTVVSDPVGTASGSTLGDGVGNVDDSDSGSGGTQIATQVFQQQDEKKERSTRFCWKHKETSETPTNESDRSDEEDCEEIDFFQRLNSQLTILRLELHLPADALTQPNSSVPRSSGLN